MTTLLLLPLETWCTTHKGCLTVCLSHCVPETYSYAELCRVVSSAGVAIAVMGCIVNGPGEMADADFGYVGGAPGKIDLYVGKEVVQRGIPMDSVSFLILSFILRL